jgi:glutathione S-transferase
MKLYGMGQSRSFRALWALEESGLDYEYINTTLRTDSSQNDSAKHPSYLELNVQGKVPTLVDGDLILTESFAIVNYIARKGPDSGLLPKVSTPAYARLDELSYFILAELEQPLWSKGKHMFALPEEVRIPAMLDTAKFEFDKAVRALDHLLPPTDSGYAIGNSFYSRIRLTGRSASSSMCLTNILHCVIGTIKGRPPNERWQSSNRDAFNSPLEPS